MPYIQSQHFRETERLTYGWSAPSPARADAAALTADPLTDLPTLTEFYRLGEPLVEESLSQGVSCAAAIVDIDHFRRLETAHDEETIARVLKALAARLEAACIGSRHLAARLGDEEFGLLLVGLDSAAAMDFCEKIRLEIAAMRFEAGAADFSITISIGLAKIRGPETFDNYLNAAEQFLFMAKNHGRNRVFSDRTVALQAAG